MSNPHYLTLGQAAKLSDVAKSTITRAINKGHLSAAQRIGNSYRIDPAELQRWQDNRVQPLNQAQRRDSTKQPDATSNDALVVHVRNAQLEAEITALKRVHEQMETSTTELKAMTDKMLRDKDREIERLYTLALTDQREVQNRTFWTRMFGTKGRKKNAA